MAIRKNLGVAQAAQQVVRNKATIYHPGASYGPYDEAGSIMKSGGTIHIKKANRGKFNALKTRTGKSTEELKHSKNPLTRKRATFAANARKWHHKHKEEGGYIDNDRDFIQDMMEKAYGGFVQEFTGGGSVAEARKRPGGSNVGKKTFANGKKRTGPYAGPGGGAPKGSYPIPDIGHARAALRLAHHAPNPAGIRAKVLAKYPQLKKEQGGWVQEYAHGGMVSSEKAREILRDGTAQGHPLTSKQKKYFGWIAGGRKAEGGYTGYEDGGRTINPAMGGYAIGGRFAYPPMVPYPPEYGFGGVLQSFAPFLNLAAPGLGSVAGAVGGMLDRTSDDKDQEEMLRQQKQQLASQSQAGITGSYRPTFSWGGRLPETRLPMSPLGLTLGHVPGYDSNSNYGGTNVPSKGWNYRMVKGKGEGTNWHRETNMNVHRHTYPVGGTVGKAVTTVRNNRFIPVTEQQFYEQAIRPYNDTLSMQQFNALPPTLVDRSRYLPNSNWKIEQGKQGSTMNKGYLKYYQNNPIDMGTDITVGGQPVFKQPSQIEVQKQFPTHSMYPMGGQINDNLEVQPVELEKQEVYQTPSGQMGQVNGPSHAEGGIDMALPENSFVWSDKLKARTGRTFADEAARLGRMKAKYEKILKG